MRRFLLAMPLMLTVLQQTTPAPRGQPVNVLTQGYDIARTGANLHETILSPASIQANGFGKLFSLSVDAEVQAQPLYVSHLSVNGNYHNVVFVATVGNSMYAFDADDPTQAATPLWKVNLGAPVPSSKYLFFAGGQRSLGIVGT